jgi:choline dehydrogenase-like flavoprotein
VPCFSKLTTADFYLTMATTNTLSPGPTAYFDYVIVGGGTAGCVVASRLSEYLPHKRVLLIEAGPCDFTDQRALILKQRVEMQGTELEYRYKSVHQPRGPFVIGVRNPGTDWMLRK